MQEVEGDWWDFAWTCSPERSLHQWWMIVWVTGHCPLEYNRCGSAEGCTGMEQRHVGELWVDVLRQSVGAQRQGECSSVVRLEAVFVVLVGCADVLSIPEPRGRTAPPRHFVTCAQVFEADLSLSCLAGWGISGALPSRFSPSLCWKWPGKWRPVPPACPHLQPPTCEETHLLRGPVKQPEQGSPAQATVCKPRAAPEQVP